MKSTSAGSGRTATAGARRQHRFFIGFLFGRALFLTLESFLFVSGAEMDVFIYNGEIERFSDLQFIEYVNKEKTSDKALLILVTPGGSPDAAYKIGRYFQHRYEDFSIFVPGYCKSAGTLLAIAANEIIFTPYGELGPLDVQMAKTDHIAGLDSGLNIGEAFVALEGRAKATFHRVVAEIIGGSGGIVSIHTASRSASDIVSALYGPIFAKFDPEEVGSRARAMRIGEDYGKRLNGKFNNLKPQGLQTLAQTYSSHGFVIDIDEAQLLFHRVRLANVFEKRLVEFLGNRCRVPGRELHIANLTLEFAQIVDGEVGNESDAADEAPTQLDGAEAGEAKPSVDGEDIVGSVTA